MLQDRGDGKHPFSAQSQLGDVVQDVCRNQLLQFVVYCRNADLGDSAA